MINYNINVKEKPEDFIVSEEAEHKVSDDGNFYLYTLIKRNLTTLSICNKLNLNYAGLKDKNALTFQYVSSNRYLGKVLKSKNDASFYILYFIGKINRKIKIGMLKGNYFNIKLKFPVKEKVNVFINYYDTQRIKTSNIEKGKKLLFSKKKKLSKIENLFIDAYISYLWNKSLENYLKDLTTNGTFLREKDQIFFIPEEVDILKISKFWPVLGYKVKLSDEERFYYNQILQKEGFLLEEFLENLREKKIKGDYRKAFENVENFKIDGNYMSFYLKKGAYATMLLKFLYTKNIVFKP